MGLLGRVVVGLLALTLVATSCDVPGGAPAQDEDLTRGGTLQLALIFDVGGLDPAKAYSVVPWELFRCCLLRTLLSYNGRPADEGGNVLRPDLATALPEVSEDGLTWTFALKRGIYYSPPFEEVEVTAGDIVRALEREADGKASVGGYAFYYSVIEGFDAFARGRADSIVGLEVPDDHTLVVHLSEPDPALGYLFAMAATAPIPPDGPDERRGAAQGHDGDYGSFLVATGPYMFKGSEDLDFSLPPEDQEGVAGLSPRRSIELVRNPAYDPATDGLRPAYPDAITISIGGESTDVYNQLLLGEFDMVLDAPVPGHVLRKAATDPALGSRLHSDPNDGILFIAMNLAEPPFDDVHVRKAVNLVIDKSGMRQVSGGEVMGGIATHVISDGLLDGTLEGYDPYATPGSSGDVAAARAEMAQSRYDEDGDGICDAAVCDEAQVITWIDPSMQDSSVLLEQYLEEIGIDFNVAPFVLGTFFELCLDPFSHVGLCLGNAWGRDYPDPATFGTPLFGSGSISPGCCNYSRVGASPELLEEAGYAVTSVPSVDEDLAACESEIGDARIACFADLDRKLMEEVVPWVPLLEMNTVIFTSERIVGYSFDQFAGLPALDRIAIAREAQ